MENATSILNRTLLADDNSNLLPYLVDAVSCLVSVIGLLGNSIALFILTTSVKIKLSKSYVLLMNQSLLDFVNSVIIIVSVSFKYLTRTDNMYGVRGWLLCHFVHSRMFVAVTICASSYNLMAISLERMVSVVWPIWHRVHVDNRGLLSVCVGLWVSSALATAAFSMPINGLIGNGRCYYWNHIPSQLYDKIYSVLFNVMITLLPGGVMIAAYVRIYVRISSGGHVTGAGRKLNVIRTLTTCVVLFFACHVLRMVIDFLTRFTRWKLMQGYVFIISIVLLQCNAAVNPIVYCCQYVDYRKELIRQFLKLFYRRRINVYDDNTSISNVNNDS